MKTLASSMLLAAALLAAAPLPSSAAQTIVKLTAVGGSGESGQAVLTDVPGSTPSVRVMIALSGEPTKAMEPAHIHKGVCGSNGPVLKPLHDVVGNKSATIIPGTSIAQLKAAHTYINIHKSAEMLSTTVSCGAIR